MWPQPDRATGSRLGDSRLRDIDRSADPERETASIGVGGCAHKPVAGADPSRRSTSCRGAWTPASAGPWRSPDGGDVVVAGGLTGNGTTGAVRRIDMATGRMSDIGHLRRPVHDASGAVIGGRLMVFGGGDSVADSAVQVVSPGNAGMVIGSLPAVRADLSTVVVGDRAFVIGGGSANGPDPRIWATTDGTIARLVGRLKIGVRYAATAVSGASIYVFGGATSTGVRSEIQRFDTTTGRTSVVGRLPVRLSHAASMVLDGRVLVIGGASSDAIWSFDPGPASVTRVGRLPYPVSDAAAVVIGSRGYLHRREDSHVPLTA